MDRETGDSGKLREGIPMSDKEQIQQEKREARRRRRVRNQVVAYVVLVALILAAAAGTVYGGNYLTKNSIGFGKGDGAGGADDQQGGSEDQDRQDAIDDIFGSEEAIPTPEPTPEPTPAVPEQTPEERLDEIVNVQIEGMPLEDKVAGLFIVTPETITGVGTAVQAGDGTRQALSEHPVGGLVYFKKNIQSEDQLRQMLTNTASYAEYPLFLAVDEEGGQVARVGSSGIGPKVDGAGDIGATGDAGNAYQAGVSIGSTLAGLGFNLDFAPVADLANVEGSVMEGRSYGSEAGSVSGFVASMTSGLRDQGVTACLKHFPGIGSSTKDTHEGMASTDRTAEQFRAEEFAVFAAGINAGAEMVMVSHMAAPSLTGNNEPCIFSEELVTGMLREELAFDGVIITDAMNMAAISDYYGADEAAVMAVLAGCDMLLMPEDYEKAYNGILAAIQEGHISEERINDSLRRIYRIKFAGKIEE